MMLCTILILEDIQIYNLPLSWRRPLSNRNQSIDLRSKSMDWFLYDNGLRLERVNRYRHSNNILNAFLAYVPFFLHSRKTRRPKVRSLGIKRKQWPEMCWITHFVSSIQKTTGFLMFSRGWRKRPVTWNGLIKLSNRDILVASVLSQNLDLDSLNQTVRPTITNQGLRITTKSVD